MQVLGLYIWTKNMANAKIYVLLYSFCFVLFWIWGQFPSTSPGRLVFGGAIYWTFFFVMSLEGLYLERFIHGVAYFQNFTVFHVCKCTLAYLSRDQIYRHLYRQKFISIVIQALLYIVQCILSQRHQLMSTIPSTVPLLWGHLYNVDTKVCPPGESTYRKHWATLVHFENNLTACF